MNILHSHVGFRPCAHKVMIVQCSEEDAAVSGDCPTESSILAELWSAGVGGRAGSRKPLATFNPESSGSVPGWKGRFFYRFDFSAFSECGRFFFRVHSPAVSVTGFPFQISKETAETDIISDILFYLKGQRSSGRWDQRDRAVPFFSGVDSLDNVGGREGTADVHGGWYDASGDYSKYLSHLSYANYLNPQQIPLTVWALLQLGQTLGGQQKHAGSLLEERAFEEAWWGADFLMRMQDPAGYFYMTVFDKWSKKNEERMICTFKTQLGERLDGYQAGFRQGGGMAVAALACAARYQRAAIPPDGFSPEQYLAAAEKGYRHLLEHNLEYLDNGRENIIDCYCALTAAVELYRTTEDVLYLQECRKWAAETGGLFSPEMGGWLVEKESSRPFYHASDSGLIIVSLLHYFAVESDPGRKAQVARLLMRALENELARASDIFNPFKLSRQLVQSADGGDIRCSFFVPHNNETGYWWQGENARLASMACAAQLAAAAADELSVTAGDRIDSDYVSEFAIRLKSFADAQLDWILGCNPFDICMLHGSGRNNPRYEPHCPNAPGGICNGITGGFVDEFDIDFLPEDLEGRSDHRWRWSEQWIPHASWFLLALSAGMKGRADDVVGERLS